MSHILRTSTEHKTASLADEGNSAYCQSSGAHNIKHIKNLWKLTFRGHLNTDVQAGLELGTHSSTNGSSTVSDTCKHSHTLSLAVLKKGYYLIISNH